MLLPNKNLYYNRFTFLEMGYFLKLFFSEKKTTIIRTDNIARNIRKYTNLGSLFTLSKLGYTKNSPSGLLAHMDCLPTELLTERTVCEHNSPPTGLFTGMTFFRQATSFFIFFC